MDMYNVREYLDEIPASIFLVKSKSGLIIFSNRLAKKAGFIPDDNFFQMLEDKNDYLFITKSKDGRLFHIDVQIKMNGKTYSAKLSVAHAEYTSFDALCVTVSALQETAKEDRAVTISKICDIYTGYSSKKTFDFLQTSAKSVGAFCAVLYEKARSRYVLKEEWRERKSVCIPVLRSDFEDRMQLEMLRLASLKRAADTAFATYKKQYGTEGVIAYYFDHAASEHDRESVSLYVRIYKKLSPDAPTKKALSVTQKGLDALSQGFVIWDAPTKKLLYDNKAYRAVFGYKNPLYLSSKIGAGIAGRSGVTRSEEYTDPEGRCYRVTHTFARLGTKDIVSTIISDITEYKQAENKLNTMAKTDALTGLPNRRAGLEQLRSVYAQSKKRKDALTVCFADIDGLKHINDTYGHGAGDSLIKAVALVLKKHVEHIGAVCRLGGDEFVLILPGLDKEQASVVTTQINRDARKYLVGNSEGISMSFGFKEAEFTQDETADTMISVADYEMYRQKRKKSVN